MGQILKTLLFYPRRCLLNFPNLTSSPVLVRIGGHNRIFSAAGMKFEYDSDFGNAEAP